MIHKMIVGNYNVTEKCDCNYEIVLPSNDDDCRTKRDDNTF